jgi:pimeloyl-ACP methyl ester carboxylesterase
MHYLDWGGNSPPAVLVHATGFCAWVWSPYARALSQHYRVVAMDQRGHGDSEKPEGAYRWNDLGNDLVGFMDACNLKNALLIGHSAGATAAVITAGKRPDLAGKLVLLEPTILLSRRAQSGEPGAHMAERARRRRAVWDSREQVYHAYRTRQTFAGWEEEPFRAYIDHGTLTRPDGSVVLKCPPAIEAQFYEHREEFDPWPFVSKLACPVLVVLGENGIPLDSEPVERWRHIRPNDRILSVQGASHFVPMERSAEVIAAVTRFALTG